MGSGADTGTRPIALDYYEPAPDIRDFVSSYYIFRADFPHVADVMRADLGQLRFMIRGSGFYRFVDGKAVRSPDICLIGPTTASSTFDVTGPLMVFGVGIHPAGWAALVRDDASRFTDAASDATDLFGPLMIDALDGMRSTASADTMVSIANVVIRALLKRRPTQAHWFTKLTDRWLTASPSPDVDQLIIDSGVSSRQVERLARRLYGAPPKLLSRKYRALQAASLIGANGFGWSEAAGDAFYDQSHFIREFKRFTGQTPRQYQTEPTPVTRLSLQRRRLAGRMSDIAVIS